MLANLILDVTIIPSIFEFQSCLFGTIELLDLLKKQRRKWKLQSDNRLGSAGKQTQYKKNAQKWENLNFLIFLNNFRTAIISNKVPWLFQSWLQLESTLSTIFFPYNTSAIAHLYGCVMEELWAAEHWGSMRDFA